MPKLVPYEENHRLNENGELEKHCNKHHIYFTDESPWISCTEEYFYKNSTNTKDGLNGLCKKCSGENNKKYNKPKNRIPERLQRTYENMRQRCYNPNAKSYKYYGEKGITICDEWLKDRKTFYNWALSNGYEENLTIDRKDTNGNYEPDNCRWATLVEQANNKTNNIFIEANGETKTASQWSQETGIGWSSIKDRFEKGKDIFEDYRRIDININGEIKTLHKLSEEYDIPYSVMSARYHNGWDVNDLIKEVSPNETQYLEINGQTHTVTEWAEISGLTREIILMRISYGWKNEDLIKPRTKEGGNKKYIEIDGVRHTAPEWCEIADINIMTYYKRVKKGLTGKELFAPVQIKYRKKISK